MSDLADMSLSYFPIAHISHWYHRGLLNRGLSSHTLDLNHKIQMVQTQYIYIGIQCKFILHNQVLRWPKTSCMLHRIFFIWKVKIQIWVSTKLLTKVRVWTFACCFGIGLNAVTNPRTELTGDIILQGDVIGKHWKKTSNHHQDMYMEITWLWSCMATFSL